ncbi:MAG: class I SAM-dependent methyltransferase [Phycisphaerae bacterium]
MSHSAPAVAQHFDRLGRTGEWADLYRAARNPRDEWSFLRRQNALETLMADLAPPGAAVVEIGPGTGNLVPFFAARGCAYRAFDIAPAMIDQTRAAIRRAFPPGADARCDPGDLACLPLPDHAADLAVAAGVFEYLPDLPAAARELARIVRPGSGHALVSLPNARSLNRILGRRLNGVTRAAHALRRRAGRAIPPPDVDRRPLAPRAAADLFRAAGFVVEALAYYDYEVLVYPLNRLAPSLAFAAKRFVEPRRLAPGCFFANAYVLRLRRAAG